MAKYKSNVVETVHYVEIPLAVASPEVDEFKKSAPTWLKLPVDVHVFDFKNVDKLTSQFYEHFLNFKKTAQSKNAQVISINFKPRILEKIVEDGQDSNFGYVKSVSAAQPTGSKDSVAEVRNWLVKYLVTASRLAMNTMFNTTVAADENFRENAKDFQPEKYPKVAFVSANSRLVKAHFRLYFEQSTLVELTKLMIKRSVPDEETINSTATELLNLIYGGAKSNLNNDRGYDLPNAIPTLIPNSKAISSRSTNLKELCVIPFVTPLGSYFLEIDFGV